jgi:hypothetical protein
LPLIWGVTALLLAPINYRHGIDGWLSQWQRDVLGPTLRMLLAGGIAGGFWEFFNFWARGKWTYTVPVFDEIKRFEMPLLGSSASRPSLWSVLVPTGCWFGIGWPPPSARFTEQGCPCEDS